MGWGDVLLLFGFPFSLPLPCCTVPYATSENSLVRGSKLSDGKWAQWNATRMRVYVHGAFAKRLVQLQRKGVASVNILDTDETLKDMTRTTSNNVLRLSR